MRRLAIALVHHPVLDKEGAIVTSAITNLDVHDLARSARTFGASDYFIVHPITAQRELVLRIQQHWAEGSSGKRIPSARRPSRSSASYPRSMTPSRRWGTERRRGLDDGSPRGDKSLEMPEARTRLGGEGGPILVVFGTAWGLAPEVHSGADGRLAPIAAESDYNHLSVRSACAIYLDRLRR